MKVSTLSTLLRICVLCATAQLSLYPLSYAGESHNSTESISLHIDNISNHSSKDARMNIIAAEMQHAIFADYVTLCDELQRLYPVLHFGELEAKMKGAHFSNSVLSGFNISSITAQTGLHVYKSTVGNLKLDSVQTEEQGIHVEYSHVGNIEGDHISAVGTHGPVSAIRIKSEGQSVGFDAQMLKDNELYEGKITIDMHASSDDYTAYGVHIEASNEEVGALRGEVEIFARGVNQNEGFAWKDNSSRNFMRILADEDEATSVSTYGNVISHGVQVGEGSYMKMVDVGESTKVSKYEILGQLDIVMSRDIGADQFQTAHESMVGFENVRVFGGAVEFKNQVSIKIGDIEEFSPGACTEHSMMKDDNHTLVYHSQDGNEMLLSFDVNSEKGVQINSVEQEAQPTANSLGWDLDLTMNPDDAFMMSVYVGDIFQGLDTDEYMLYHLNDEGERINLDASHVSYFEKEGLLHFSVEHEDTNNGVIKSSIMFEALAIPEPSSTVLSILGLLSICGYRRRRGVRDACARS